VILYEILNRSGYRALARTLYRIEIAGTERTPPSGRASSSPNTSRSSTRGSLALTTPRTIRYTAKAELRRPYGEPKHAWIEETA
jgi:hypothetical protein